MEILGKRFKGPLAINSIEIPDVSCVYILVNSDSPDFTPLYVGRTSRSLKLRIRELFFHSKLNNALSDGKAVQVYFCEFDPNDQKGLNNLERLLIEYYEPRYNTSYRYKPVDEQVLKELKELEIRSAKKSAFTALSLGISFVLLTISFVGFFSNESYISKSDIQNTIITAMKNEADLRAIEHIYLNREKVDKSLFKAFKSDANLYPYNTPFSTILEGIRTDMFLENGDKSLLKKVDILIEQHLHTNPFDRLEPIQRDYFENIKIKLDDKYPDVIIEVNKIADELHSKNTLVDEYLKDSNTSFWVSVFALIFSVVVSSYQIFNGRASRVQRLFAESLSKVQSSTESKDT